MEAVDARSAELAKGFITYSTAVILQAVDHGYRYGFDIIDITGMPGGTVYPALRRLEEGGHLTSKWENPNVARAEPRPPRKYYELTRAGRDALAEAVKRYRLLEQTQSARARTPRPSRT
jgi:PadR family transcriptional regulator PadR